MSRSAGRAPLWSGWATGRPTTGMPFCRSFEPAPSQASKWCRAAVMRARSRSATSAVHWLSSPRRPTFSRQPFACQISGTCRRCIARVRRVFDLAADPLAIGAHLGQDPVLAPLVAARPGLRVPGAWDGFELAVRAILGQQITVSAATRLAGKLVSSYGEKIANSTALDLGLTHVFPTPRQLAAADLATLGMPKARLMALSSLAAAVVADPLIFGPRRSLEEAITRLRSLAGVGEWTAQYIAMRELREPDAFPGRRYRSHAGDERCQRVAAVTRRAARARRAVATLACLCGAASLGVRAARVRCR